MESVNDSPAIFNSYPDRGIRAYSVVLGAWLALFPASGLLNSTGIFQAWLLDQELGGYSESQISWIFSVFAFLFFFGGCQAGSWKILSTVRCYINTIDVGPLFDHYGLTYLLPCGAFGLVISLVCTSVCKGMLYRALFSNSPAYSRKNTTNSCLHLVF